MLIIFIIIIIINNTHVWSTLNWVHPNGPESLANSDRMTFAECAWSAVCLGHPAMHELLFFLKFSF